MLLEGRLAQEYKQLWEKCNKKICTLNLCFYVMCDKNTISYS